MKRYRPIMKCECHYCGFQWQFEAKSKADAARMTGFAVCGKDECRDANVARIMEKIIAHDNANPRQDIRLIA